MLRQMRLLYAKFNKLLGTLSHCSSDVKVARYQSYIVQHCIGHSCLAIIKSLKKLVKFVSHFIIVYSLSKRSSASEMYATYNICNFERMLGKNIIIWCYARSEAEHITL